MENENKSSIFDIFKIDSRSKFTLKFWKSNFWKLANLGNIWKFVFTTNIYNVLAVVFLVAAATIYMVANNSDGYELMPIAMWIGILWGIPSILTYVTYWLILIIKGKY